MGLAASCAYIFRSPLYPQSLGCSGRLPMILLRSLFGLFSVQPPLALESRGMPRAPPSWSPCQYHLCTLLPQEATSFSRGDSHYHQQMTDTYRVITWDSESSASSTSGTRRLPNPLPNTHLIIRKHPLVRGAGSVAELRFHFVHISANTEAF